MIPNTGVDKMSTLRCVLKAPSDTEKLQSDLRSTCKVDILSTPMPDYRTLTLKRKTCT